MSYRFMDYMDWEERKELIEALKSRFKDNEISEASFRIKLASLGFNAAEIDREVEDCKS